jgi:NAD(P)-dependent dehydrogenase (short-subunit alcohol dehydrogenase family)
VTEPAGNADGTGEVVVIGGTAGIGDQLARHYAARGSRVTLTGRDKDRAAAAADQVARGAGGQVGKWAGEPAGRVRGVALDLSRPEDIAGALAEVGPVSRVVLSAIDRDQNTVAGYDLDAARYLVTLKLLGYTEVVHALLPRFVPGAAVLVFGGQARVRPYPGSLTVSTVNGGVEGMVRAMAVELAPVRVNAIHPGIVGDSPYWAARPPEVLQAILDRTPARRLATMADVVDAAVFLLENPAVDGANLVVDGGWVLM